MGFTVITVKGTAIVTSCGSSKTIVKLPARTFPWLSVTTWAAVRMSRPVKSNSPVPNVLLGATTSTIPVAEGVPGGTTVAF